MTIEYKSLDFEIKSIDKKGIFKGIASPYNNIDLGNDRVLSSISIRNNNKNVPYLWQHDSREPIGMVHLISTEKGIEVEGKLYLDENDNGIPLIPNAHKAYVLMKNGQLKNSIGYNTLKSKYVTENNKTIRELIDIDIKEVSAVTFPMNEMANIVSVKSVTGNTNLPLADRNKMWDGPRAEKRVLDKYRNEDGIISEEARKAFFYVDTENPNIRLSYKLGFADIIDGELKAVPRAIIAVAGVLQGARGGVDIPEEDKVKIKSKVSEYYKKMDMVAPWDKKEVNNLELKEQVEDLKKQLDIISNALNLDEKQADKDYEAIKKYIRGLSVDSPHCMELYSILDRKINGKKDNESDLETKEALKELYNIFKK